MRRNFLIALLATFTFTAVAQENNYIIKGNWGGIKQRSARHSIRHYFVC